MKKVPHALIVASLLAVLAAVALMIVAIRHSEPSPQEIVPPLAGQKETPSFLSRFEFPLPSKPAPTPRSEQDEAIHQLSLLGLEPTGAALALRLQLEGDAPIPVNLFLKAGVTADATDPQGRPLLLLACEAGRLAEASALLLAGADPNATAPDGLSSLMAAARSGQPELLASLLEKGATLEGADADGHTALHHAILSTQPEAARWLLEAGALPTACCHGTGSLSLHALEAGNPRTLETALNAEKPTEWHPRLAAALLEAARTGDRALSRLLIAHHEAAPPHPESRHPLLGYAVLWGDHDLLRLLLECGADANTPLESPVDPVFAELVTQKTLRYYLSREAGMTPLMLAAGRGDFVAVEALLEHGAKRNALTQKSKWPALSFAAQTGNIEVMQLLLGKTPAPDDQQMRIEISLSGQTARLWRNSELAFTTRISTGRAGYRTPPGRFVITDKIRNRISSIYRVNMPYFMRLNCSAIGMHAGNVPGYPASHGCIRVPAGNAAKLFREVPVGTLVIIR